MRSTVRAESMAALPPPMMATREPIADFFAAGDGLEEDQRRKHVLQLGSRQIEPGLLPGSDGDEDGVEVGWPDR